MFRQVHTGLWAEPWFEPLSADAKLLFLYLTTCGEADPAGFVSRSQARITHDTGISDVAAALDQLNGRVLATSYPDLLWIRRYSRYQGSGPKWAGAIRATLRNGHLPAQARAMFVADYPEYADAIPQSVYADTLCDTVSHTLPDTNGHKYGGKEKVKGISESERERDKASSLRSDALAAATSRKRNTSRYRSFEDVRADAALMSQLRTRFPTVDLNYELDKCEEWWRSNGKTVKSPKLASQNWLEKATQIAANVMPPKGEQHGIPGNRPAGAFDDIE